MKLKTFGKAAIAVAAAACMVAALAGCSGGSSSSSGSSDSSSGGSGQQLRFVTGGSSGTYFAFGSVLANHATNNAGISVTALEGNGSAANIAELQDGTAELAFCQSDVMAYAYGGTEQWAELGSGDAVTDFSTVAALYDEQVQIVTCDPDIKTVADLKGKSVSVGAAGSGVYFNAIDALKAYDLTLDDIKPTYETFADTTNSIKDGKIDAGFVVAGAPTTSITDLFAGGKQAYLVGFDDEHVDKLLASSPYYSKSVIPAETYQGQADDVTTVSVGAVVLAKDTVAAEDVKAFVADIFTDPASKVDDHAKYAELSLDKAASVTSVPYHPGAAEYFAEQGLTVPTK